MDSLGDTPPSVRAAIERFRIGVQARFGPRLRELVLFGSYARGDADDESDVDLLVVIDELSEAERREVFDLAYDADAADREHWSGLAPIVYSTAWAQELRRREKLLLQDVDREGVRL
ncbi:MAG: nucleotidyltransferase domain-containing protein [Myxococcales bacterium]|nr:nucleotidyltransferase domain-containing protein [Myxococcales bacterium]